MTVQMFSDPYDVPLPGLDLGQALAGALSPKLPSPELRTR